MCGCAGLVLPAFGPNAPTRIVKPKITNIEETIMAPKRNIV